MTRPICILASLVFAGSNSHAQPQPEPQAAVLKVETAAVAVDVIVTDRKGRHVTGLTAADFKLFENNTQQTIASFIPPPGKAERGTAVVPPVGVSSQVPAVPPPQGAPPQLITLVIDVGNLQFEHLKQACKAASRFAEKTVAAGNSVALYWVDSSLHLAVPFSQDRTRLIGVLEKIGNRAPLGQLSAREGVLTETGVADLFASVQPLPEGAGRGGRLTAEQVLQQELNRQAVEESKMAMSWLVIASSFRARAVFMALRALAMGYRTMPGRKTVVLFSGGFLHSKLAEEEMQAVVDAANRANVAIYVIDASGLNSGRDGAMVNAQFQRPDMTGGQKIAQTIAGMRDKDSQASGIGRHEWAQTLGSDLSGDLGVVADKTGGFLVRDTNDLAPSLDRVQDDASEFYTLVYYPLNHHYDGAFRTIRLELGERTYRMRYRQGYWGLPPGREVMMTPAAAQLLAAVESGERKPSFTPRVNAVLAPSPDGGFAIAAAVSMPGKLVRLDKLKDQHVGGVTLLLIARNPDGQLLSIQERYADVRIKPEEQSGFSSGIFNLQGHVAIPELAPVNLEAIVRFADGTLGISEPEILRPAAGASTFRVTSLALSDHEADSDCPSDPLDPLCMKGVRIFLPAQRRFVRTNSVVFCFGLSGLELGENQQPSIGVTFQLGSAGALVAIKPHQFFISPGAGPHSFLALGSFDLRGQSPGDYTLEMTAEDKIQHVQAHETTSFELQ